MKTFPLVIVLICTQLLTTIAVRAGEGHAHNSRTDHKAIASSAHQHSANESAGDTPDEAHDDAATIATDMAQRLGIKVSSAGAGKIERHIPLYGELVIPPGRQAQVRARFPGMVVQTKAGVGQKVSKGDVLALIESNDSLSTYPLKAPISGVVLQQYASTGEYLDAQPLFALVDSSELWAELKVFPAAREEIKPGLPIHIDTQSGRVDGHISHILPAAGQPYVLVRVALDNASGRFAAGERVSALVDAEIAEVALVVDNRALQQFEGSAVVFVRDGNRYEPRAVKLGRSDGRFSEVLSGLRALDNYVVQNSYLIKAELEKAGAAHEH